MKSGIQGRGGGPARIWARQFPHTLLNNIFHDDSPAGWCVGETIPTREMFSPVGLVGLVMNSSQRLDGLREQHGDPASALRKTWPVPIYSF